MDGAQRHCGEHGVACERGEYVIRRAEPSDILALSRMQAQAWQETYAGLLPDDFNHMITTEFIRGVRERGGVDKTFVAVEAVIPKGASGGGIVGFCDYLPCERHNPERGYPEIAALYVLRSAQGMGLGRRLIERAMAEVPAGPVSLLVFEGNERAIGFYKHMGFGITGVRLKDDAMTDLEMVRQ